MVLYQEFSDIAHAFEAADIAYAVVGGFALAFHGKPRFTHALDLITTVDQIPAIQAALNQLDDLASAPPWAFRKTNLHEHRLMRIEGAEHFLVDILAGEDEHTREIIANAIEDELSGARVKIANRDYLI